MDFFRTDLVTAPVTPRHPLLSDLWHALPRVQPLRSNIAKVLKAMLHCRNCMHNSRLGAAYIPAVKDGSKQLTVMYLTINQETHMHWWRLLYPEDALAHITKPPHTSLTL